MGVDLIRTACDPAKGITMRTQTQRTYSNRHWTRSPTTTTVRLVDFALILDITVVYSSCVLPIHRTDLVRLLCDGYAWWIFCINTLVHPSSALCKRPSWHITLPLWYRCSCIMCFDSIGDTQDANQILVFRASSLCQTKAAAKYIYREITQSAIISNTRTHNNIIILIVFQSY